MKCQLLLTELINWDSPSSNVRSWWAPDAFFVLLALPNLGHPPFQALVFWIWTDGNCTSLPRLMLEVVWSQALLTAGMQHCQLCNLSPKQLPVVLYSVLWWVPALMLSTAQCWVCSCNNPLMYTLRFCDLGSWWQSRKFKSSANAVFAEEGMVLLTPVL